MNTILANFCAWSRSCASAYNIARLGNKITNERETLTLPTSSDDFSFAENDYLEANYNDALTDNPSADSTLEGTSTAVSSSHNLRHNPPPQVDNSPDREDITGNTCASVAMSTSSLCDNARKMGLTAAMGAIIGIAGSAVASLGYNLLGAIQLKKGLQERNIHTAINGAGNIFDGMSNGASAIKLATIKAQTGSFVTSMGKVAGALTSPLAIASSSVNVILGAKDVHDGLKSNSRDKIISGALGIGFGVTSALATIGGGLPAFTVSGLILIAKCGINLKQIRDARQQPS